MPAIASLSARSAAVIRALASMRASAEKSIGRISTVIVNSGKVGEFAAGD